jgi:hypothetical protein
MPDGKQLKSDSDHQQESAFSILPIDPLLCKLFHEAVPEGRFHFFRLASHYFSATGPGRPDGKDKM